MPTNADPRGLADQLLQDAEEAERAVCVFPVSTDPPVIDQRVIPTSDWARNMRQAAEVLASLKVEKRSAFGGCTRYVTEWKVVGDGK